MQVGQQTAHCIICSAAADGLVANDSMRDTPRSNFSDGKWHMATLSTLPVAGAQASCLRLPCSTHASTSLHLGMLTTAQEATHGHAKLQVYCQADPALRLVVVILKACSQLPSLAETLCYLSLCVGDVAF